MPSTTGSLTLVPTARAAAAPQIPSLVPGAQSTVAADSFDSRWAIRR
jgi:hypothetical protein